MGDFRFLSEEEIARLDLLRVSIDSPTGYIVDCDLDYPDHLHDDHSDYPLAAEHLEITADMLSARAKSLRRDGWKPSTKLVPNLYDKKRYVTHYRNLQLYVARGLTLRKMHRVLSFSQSRWLKPWVDLCTAQRQNAASEFESDLAKLKANCVYGKTIEQVRNRVNIALFSNERKLRKALCKPSYRNATIVNPELTMVRSALQKVTLNKPIAVGFCILELSKLFMYDFWYGFLRAKYGRRCRLLFTDTDSLCCEIETSDVYADMGGAALQHFDTSNFPVDHPLYSTVNHRRVGKMKSETGSTPPTEFVGLRSKMYSLKCGDGMSHKRVKGAKKSCVRKRVDHDAFLRILNDNLSSTRARFRQFRSTNHVVRTVELDKLCLVAFDDKRSLNDDGIETLAYGHYSLRRRPVDDIAATADE